jgi:hypothetical protein
MNCWFASCGSEKLSPVGSWWSRVAIGTALLLLPVRPD